MIELIDDDKTLVMSDKAHLHLDGYINKQNFYYLSDSHPQELHKSPLHNAKTAV